MRHSPDNSAPLATDILTPEEIESIELAQNLYSAKAKEAVATFAEIIGLEEAGRAQLIGAVAVELEELDFEQRREVAQRFTELSAVLGGQAVEAAHGETGLALVSRGGGSDPSRQPHLAADSGEAVASNGADPVAPTPETVDLPPAEPLTAHQTDWLGKLFGGEAVRRVGALSLDQRIEFAVNLSDKYKELRVRRLSPDGKRQRAEQLIGLMSGQSYKQLAETAGVETQSIRAALATMTKTIRNGLTDEEVLGCIPTPGEVPPESAEEESAEDLGLSRAQRNWCAKLLDNPEGVERVEQLTPRQRQVFAELLERRLRAYNIRRNGPVRTNRQVEQMFIFLSGATEEKISEVVNLPVANVKAELHSIVKTLHDRTSQTDLEGMLDVAASSEDENQHGD